MLIKIVLSTLSGSVEAYYGTVAPTIGGYASLEDVGTLLAEHGVLLNHGDTMKVEFVDQIEDRTAEDERQLVAHG